MPFGSNSRCGATLGVTHVQTFQTFCQDLPDSNSRRHYAIWVYFRMRRDPWSNSCPDIPDIFSRPSRLKFSARLCNLGLNPDAARSLERLMSRHFRHFVKTFQTQILGATMPFGSNSGCGATLGATHVQTFQTFFPDLPDSNSRRDSAIWV